MPDKRPTVQGFTLIEMTLVLVIVALLSGGLLTGLSAQQQSANEQAARLQLETSKEALLGFAMSQGRLPCPAPANLANTAADAGQENCTLEHGVLPWVTLGLPETDPWGLRLSYYAHNKFTSTVPAGAQASFELATTGNANIKNSAGAGYDIASLLPAVIVSHGRRGAGGYLPNGLKQPGSSGEELENSDADTTFIAHVPNDNFDDHVAWIIPTILKARLVAVGRLP